MQIFSSFFRPKITIHIEGTNKYYTDYPQKMPIPKVGDSLQFLGLVATVKSVLQNLDNKTIDVIVKE